MKAALLDQSKNVIGLILDAPEKGYTVLLAGHFTIHGDPVNVRTRKISRSKKNIEKAEYTQTLDKVTIKGFDYFTFHDLNSFDCFRK